MGRGMGTRSSWSRGSKKSLGRTSVGWIDCICGAGLDCIIPDVQRLWAYYMYYSIRIGLYIHVTAWKPFRISLGFHHPRAETKLQDKPRLSSLRRAHKLDRT